MDRLKTKRALVTGGTSGIGLETARQFLKEGARVAITGSNQATLDAAQAELGEVLAIRADAGDVAGQKTVVEAMRKELGALDIAFFNAGIGDFRPVEHVYKGKGRREIGTQEAGRSGQ